MSPFYAKEISHLLYKIWITSRLIIIALLIVSWPRRSTSGVLLIQTAKMSDIQECCQSHKTIVLTLRAIYLRLKTQPVNQFGGLRKTVLYRSSAYNCTKDWRNRLVAPTAYLTSCENSENGIVLSKDPVCCSGYYLFVLPVDGNTRCS